MECEKTVLSVRTPEGKYSLQKMCELLGEKTASKVRQCLTSEVNLG